MPGTGNGKRNRETGNGNREPGIGVWELVYSGNPLEKWWTKQNVSKCHGCKGEFLPAVHTDDSTFLSE